MLPTWYIRWPTKSCALHAVHWKRNIFQVRKGNIGKQFVDEFARLYVAFADGSALESVSLKAAIVMPNLLLQKPHHSSKTSPV